MSSALSSRRDCGAKRVKETAVLKRLTAKSVQFAGGGTTVFQRPIFANSGDGCPTITPNAVFVREQSSAFFFLRKSSPSSRGDER